VNTDKRIQEEINDNMVIEPSLTADDLEAARDLLLDDLPDSYAFVSVPTWLFARLIEYADCNMTED
jgi:hypothetical protein